MKISVYSDKFVEFFFEEEKATLFEHWTSEHITDEIYESEIQNKQELLSKYKPQFILDDISHSDYSITPEIQARTAQILVPTLTEIQLKKYAVLLPQSIFAQVSMEQTVEEAKEIMEENIFPIEYFEDEASALAWLWS